MIIICYFQYMRQKNSFSNAVIAYANNCKFRPGETVHYKRVMSRMLLWCKAGHGEVIVNGESFQFQPGSYLMLCWGHEIMYKADKREPFLVAGVHIIPWCRPGVPVDFAVAHQPGDPLAFSPYRRDVAISELDRTRTGTFAAVPELDHLCEYCVLVFDAMRSDEPLARSLAVTLLKTIIRACAGSGEGRAALWPDPLQKMISYVEKHIQEPMSLDDLSIYSDLSASAVGRMFKKHTGVTPVEWIREIKMKNAKTLLATTHLGIAEVGRRIGIEDFYYFSKLFKKQCGISPLRYRRRERLL
jgi:AraC-like DNA-binding protein